MKWRVLWPVWQLGAAVEHYDVILTLGLHTTSRVAHTPIIYVSLSTIIPFSLLIRNK